MTWLKYLFYLLLFIAMVGFSVLFSVQNDTQVSLDLLVWKFSEHRLALWVLAAFAVGGIAGLMISAVAILHLRTIRLRLQRRLSRAEAELQKLRATAAG